MGHSYKQMLIWVTDGDYRNTSGNARASRSRDKPMDRRIKRREHAQIVREAVHSFYEDQAITRMDYLNLEDWGDYDNDFSDSMYELAREYEDDQYDDFMQSFNDHSDDYYDDYYDYPDPFWDVEYNPSPYSYRREEDPHDRIIKPEDTGKTLGEILQEFEQRKHERW